MMSFIPAGKIGWYKSPHFTWLQLFYPLLLQGAEFHWLFVLVHLIATSVLLRGFLLRDEELKWMITMWCSAGKHQDQLLIPSCQTSPDTPTGPVFRPVESELCWWTYTVSDGCNAGPDQSMHTVIFVSPHASVVFRLQPRNRRLQQRGNYWI